MTELGEAVRAGPARGDAPVLDAARGTLADGEIVANAAVMMFGGIETTEGMIANLPDRVLGGADVRAAELVRVSLTGANRDPAVFDHPDDFALDRDNTRQHLAFARGPHACIAMDLARLETRVLVATVLDRLPGLRLTAPVRARGLVFRKPDAVPAAWSC